MCVGASVCVWWVVCVCVEGCGVMMGAACQCQPCWWTLPQGAGRCPTERAPAPARTQRPHSKHARTHAHSNLPAPASPHLAKQGAQVTLMELLGQGAHEEAEQLLAALPLPLLAAAIPIGPLALQALWRGLLRLAALRRYVLLHALCRNSLRLCSLRSGRLLRAFCAGSCRRRGLLRVGLWGGSGAGV